MNAEDVQLLRDAVAVLEVVITALRKGADEAEARESLRAAADEAEA